MKRKNILWKHSILILKYLYWRNSYLVQYGVLYLILKFQYKYNCFCTRPLGRYRNRAVSLGDTLSALPSARLKRACPARPSLSVFTPVMFVWDSCTTYITTVQVKWDLIAQRNNKGKGTLLHRGTIKERGPCCTEEQQKKQVKGKGTLFHERIF